MTERWIPACAGMTGASGMTEPAGNEKADISFVIMTRTTESLDYFIHSIDSKF